MIIIIWDMQDTNRVSFLKKDLVKNRVDDIQSCLRKNATVCPWTKSSTMLATVPTVHTVVAN